MSGGDKTFKLSVGGVAVRLSKSKATSRSRVGVADEASLLMQGKRDAANDGVGEPGRVEAPDDVVEDRRQLL